ncbi:cutinase family protein [Corynebacterium diphtheriae]|uniref:cutinase family protein n=1 Tax=Corynebacterium diphtheriae TaxID=1717 RepID=UPI00024694EA|nr:cutinase family protein [Corynebacterium diphtheriae]AEX70798.1 envelope lipids regulation factor [Corynebacterium diphtheriae PW8]OKY21108.1 carbohydrate esterase [Corynebacterium diphtheriae]UEB38363.1 cutinase family protein [Corynebacterium diphtheriae]WLF42416.1 cutinase family protein [Corynebacterium diphtheriae]CAB0619584.1 cutinase family protein [Corynebacterium diphtheriae]
MKKLLTVVATVVVLVIILAGVVRWMNTSSDEQPGSLAAPSSSEQPSQPDSCPAVEVISAPGTWESARDDDPLNPMANPASFMLSISRPLQEQYAGDVLVWTLPYTAQFRNINSQEEMSYDESRQEGTSTLEGELVRMHKECPQTDFVMAGFSQGAVIVGDIANRIGTGAGVIPAERVRGVALIADGRREPGVGQAVGNPVAGVGAEIALQPLNLLVQPIVPGATMRGPRVGGFGDLDAKTVEICAPDDTICDAPRDVGNALARAQALVEANGVHALYATNPNVFPGTTTNQWVVDWIKGLIDG